MSEIKIEKGVEIPKMTRGAGLKPRTSKYPFAEMEVNDSFFVAVEPKKFSGTVYAAAKRTGKKFTIRAWEGGCRVWRTV